MQKRQQGSTEKVSKREQGNHDKDTKKRVVTGRNVGKKICQELYNKVAEIILLELLELL